MTEDRAEALMVLTLDEIPTWGLGTILNHLKEALKDRRRYRNLVRHCRDGLCKYLDGLESLDPFDGATVAHMAKQLNDDRKLLETHLGIAPTDPVIQTWEEVDALQRRPLPDRDGQTEASEVRHTEEERFEEIAYDVFAYRLGPDEWETAERELRAALYGKPEASQ